MKTLYLTYDGLTDPLGQSQILPYLTNLAKRNHDITIISSEKKYNRHIIPEIETLLKQHGIKWHYRYYTKSPPVLSAIFDILRYYLISRKLCRTERFDFIHCRSSITALVGMQLKKMYKIPFIYDMRGFYADERIDGRMWPQRSFIYRILYKFFKRREAEFLTHATFTISLTEKAKTEILTWRTIPGQPIPIRVIPCCTNEKLFDYKTIRAEDKKRVRETLNLGDSDLTLVYEGAIGTWYMLNEMLDFFSRLLLRNPTAKFLFITHESRDQILKKVRLKKIDESGIRIAKVKHAEVPVILSICDLSIFFIRPLYSKMASSPVKQGEIMSMGIPLICNSNIGDTDKIIKEAEGGIILRTFAVEDYDFAVSEIPELLKRSKEKIRDTAVKYFSLEQGINNYNEIYQLMKSNHRNHS